jgi:hypothetical protein
LAKLALVTLVALSLALLVQYAKANSGAEVRIYDQNGNEKNLFQLGDKVQIVTFLGNTPYILTVTDPDGIQVVSTRIDDNGFRYIYANITTKITTDPNHLWVVRADDQAGEYAVGNYNVVPEVQLGTIAVLGAFLADFGVRYVKRKPKTL